MQSGSSSTSNTLTENLGIESLSYGVQYNFLKRFHAKHVYAVSYRLHFLWWYFLGNVIIFNLDILHISFPKMICSWIIVVRVHTIFKAFVWMPRNIFNKKLYHLIYNILSEHHNFTHILPSKNLSHNSLLF